MTKTTGHASQIYALCVCVCVRVTECPQSSVGIKELKFLAGVEVPGWVKEMC